MMLSVGYDSRTSTLEVEFKQGAIWEYHDVPESLYHEMRGAASIGTFFSAHIKGHFPENRVG
jgi:hypothetical protein